MKKLPLLVMALFCAMFGLQAQSNFLVYSFKGNVSVVENGAEGKAKIGKVLNSNASIKIPANAAVTLICNEAAMFTISKAGNYPLSKFGDSCKVSSSSVSANYVKYVWASMTKSTGSAGSDRKTYMNTVGAVSRSVNAVWIDPILDTLNYSSGEFPLSWKCYDPDTKSFDFFIYTTDNLADPFYKARVSKLKIPVTDFSAKLTAGKAYYWTAMIPDTENDQMKYFHYYTKAEFEKILADIKAMGGSAYESPAEQAYRIGFLLEDKHFLAEAYQYYTKAASLDTSNALYRSTLMSFKKDYEIK